MYTDVGNADTCISSAKPPETFQASLGTIVLAMETQAASVSVFAICFDLSTRYLTLHLVGVSLCRYAPLFSVRDRAHLRQVSQTFRDRS